MQIFLHVNAVLGQWIWWNIFYIYCLVSISTRACRLLTRRCERLNFTAYLPLLV